MKKMNNTDNAEKKRSDAKMEGADSGKKVLSPQKEKDPSGSGESSPKDIVRKRVILTALIIAAGIAAVVVFSAVRRSSRSVSLPMAWSNADMVYNDAGQNALRSPDPFTANLCVGDDDVGIGGVTLSGSTEHAGLFSLDERKIMYSHDIYSKIYPASITKIMTAIVALKDGNMDDEVTVNWQDLELETGSSVAGLQIGDTLTMRQLMYGMLVHSGNDCAQAIARHVGGTQENFVSMMNEELNVLGCTGSHFVNPTGLHDENHYTTVYDIYLMLNAAMQYDDFVTIAQTSVYDLICTGQDGTERHITLDSTDQYLTGVTEPPRDVTVVGGKTGTTSAAGSCLALISQNAYGQFYISIVTGAQTKADLYTDMNALLSCINS